MRNLIRSSTRGLAVLASVASLTLASVGLSKADAPYIPVSEAYSVIKDNPNMLVLDVRTPAEYTGELGHIDNAVNIDFRAIPDALASGNALFDLPKSAPILVHCHTDVRATIAAQTLSAAGFENITIIDDGMVAWTKAGLPVSRGP